MDERDRLDRLEDEREARHQEHMRKLLGIDEGAELPWPAACAECGVIVCPADRLVEGRCPRCQEDRRHQRAVEQLAATIRRHLCGPAAPPPGPVRLTDGQVLNLARHIAMCLGEYGRKEAA